MSEPRAVIFVNGELPDPAAARRMIRAEDYLVAADGGLHHLMALDLTPHLVVGDLDSVTPAELAELEARQVEIHRFPPKKDETDLELALQVVREAGYREILLVAALGGRLDQTLGNLYLLTDAAIEGCRVRMDDGLEEVFVIRGQVVVQGAAGDVVSLLPVAEAAHGVTTDGLAYPLRGETLWRQHTRGISNKMTGEMAKVVVEDGALFCIHTRQPTFDER
jgi:thiamine pyrophosphokinase